ncbi:MULTISPECIES: dicarboxylate/amino acid:cation symporter [Labrys]|uniref:dicarboxylate/amino acid:cation symporter n=1 Tax=Labrys TaxID=204476 RepID=UPI001FD82070|nr:MULTISPECIES: cation:dicarboxylase symporter family transporter [Labrys]
MRRISQSPWTVIASVVLGALCGAYLPDFAKSLAPISDAYLNLLKMIVLPLIVSATVFAIKSMTRDPQTAAYLSKVVMAIVVVSVATVAITGTVTLLLKPGVITDVQERIQLGTVLNSRGPVGTDLQMTLAPPSQAAPDQGAFSGLLELIPSNIFNSLSVGNTMQVLVFCLLFGIGIGRVPAATSVSFANALETIYRACLIMTGWFNVLLPLASFAIIASQTASTGVEPLMLMVGFILTFAIATGIIIMISLLVVWLRSGETLWATFKAHQPLFMIAIATRSSTASIPWIISLVGERLRFNRIVVEMLVPLHVTMLRTGPIMLFVCGSLFIAQLYGRSLSTNDYIYIAGASILVGLTTAGMSGAVTLSQMAILCAHLNLPFEAPFVLFLTIDALTDTMRTLTVVSTIAAATAAIAPRDSAQHPIDESEGFALNVPKAEAAA